MMCDYLTPQDVKGLVHYKMFLVAFLLFIGEGRADVGVNLRTFNNIH